MKKIEFEELKLRNYPAWGFRENVPYYPLGMNFLFYNGGMGDYLTWITPVRWLASEAQWIKGKVIHPNYLKEVLDYFLKPYPEWTSQNYKDFQETKEIETTPFRGPLILEQQPLNATGAHLLTCGWVYFTNKEGPPEGVDPWTSNHLGIEVGWNNYPQFDQKDLDSFELPEEAKQLESKKYAVITTGITTESRRVPQGGWTPVIEHIKARGLTPVFLGKSVTETGNVKNIHTEFVKGVDFSSGVDLRDKTSLLQAASIMSRAAFVVGHDNGLLHLAGCTRVPIIFGYNIASPEHREPRRPIGKIYNVHLTYEELRCNFCQSKTNFVIGFNYRNCFYNDNLCMRMLFENGATRWKKAIDCALEENQN